MHIALKKVWAENEWMKYRDIPEFTPRSKLEEEMTGASFLSFLHHLREFLVKKGLPLEDLLIINLTSNFEGVRMFKYSTDNSEVYIWYSKIVQLKEDGTKEDSILIFAVLEHKEDVIFSDDLLIPFYSQMFDLATKGAVRTVNGGEKHLLIFFTLCKRLSDQQISPRD